ncbi:MAG: hypothetical protein ACXAD7_03625 [Candidatus Kariarchaeaceae archaeon]|jgi:hypothetical protein
MLSTTLTNQQIDYFENWSRNNYILRWIEDAEMYLRNDEIKCAMLAFRKLEDHHLGKLGMAKCRVLLEDYEEAIKLREQATLMSHGYGA